MGKEIEVESGIAGCVVHIPAQNGLEGFHLTNTAASGGKQDDIDLTGVINTIHATLPCIGGSTNAAKQEVNVTITGDNENNEETGVTVTDFAC